MKLSSSTITAAAALTAALSVAMARAHDGHQPKATNASVDAHRREDFGFAGFVGLDAQLQRSFDSYRDAFEGFRAPATVTAASSAALTPDVVGAWSAVFDAPVVAVQVSLLQDGTLLLWDSIGDDPAEQHQPHTFTRAALWDPASNRFTRIDSQTGFNLFCAGFAHLPDGRVFIAGGNRDADQNGIDAMHVYDPLLRAWTLLPTRMGGERWYPSVTPLASGELLITSGRYDTPEVYAPDGTFRLLRGSVLALPYYPWIHAAPDGRAFNFGPDDALRFLDTNGAGRWSQVGRRGDGLERGYGSFGLYDIGQVLAAGGADSVRSAMVVDFADPNSRPAARFTADMAFGRRQHNMTVLPDGTVVVTGGNSSGAILVDKNAPVNAAELWNPATGQWRTLAAAQRSRQYHSTAILLPDGRVFTGGGGICGTCFEVGYLERNYEILSPPYLFRKDGSGALATRPRITAAPGGVSYDERFMVATPNAAQITSAVFMRIASVTHSVDFEQRRIPVRLAPAADGLQLTAPANANVAPPGYYMLFLLDGDGVPSVARILFLAPGAGLAAPLLLSAQPAATAVDLRWIGVPGAMGYDVWYGTNAAALDQRATVEEVTRFTVGRLAGGQDYFFAVVARSGAGTGGPSNVIAARTTTSAARRH